MVQRSSERRFRCRFLALLLLLLAVGPLAAGERPTVALVLSGGGAKGMAHLGVIRVLEELRVPVDIVVGTSMGAIVGGLYAAGWDPVELEREVLRLDWSRAFRDQPDREIRALRRRQEDRDLPGQITLGLRQDGIAFPRGLVQGHYLTANLRGFAARADGIDDFDALPIRYRAMAVDLETGEPVLLADGDLTSAMRASMSIPGLVAPVERDGRLLVDGGLLNNIPVDIARALGADVIITVDVGADAVASGDLDNPLAVMNQALDIMMRHRSEVLLASLGPRDILIEPDFTGIPISAVDFLRVREASVAGMLAARARLAELQHLALDADRYRIWQQGHRREQVPPLVPDFVRVVNDSALDDAILRSRIRQQPGEPLDRELLEHDINVLYGMGHFEHVDYRLERDDRGREGVVITASAKSWGPNYLRLGLTLEDDFRASATYQATASLLLTEVNRMGAEWRTDLQLGNRPRVLTEFWQPFGSAARWFVAPRLEAKRESVPVFEDRDQVGETRVSRQRAGLHLGYEISPTTEVRTGLEFGRGQSRPRVLAPELERFDFTSGEVFVQLARDRLDNPRFPTRGYSARLVWLASDPALAADERHQRLEGSWLGAWTGQRNTLLTGVRFGTYLRGDAPVYDLFSLGGFLNLSGFQQGELTGAHLGLGRAIVYRRIAGGGDSGLFGLPTYVGASLEAGNVWQERGDADLDDLVYSGSLLLGVDAPIGAVYAGYGQAEGRRGNVYLFLGQQF